jgi:hypothetical protein
LFANQLRDFLRNRTPKDDMVIECPSPPHATQSPTAPNDNPTSPDQQNITN